MTYQEYLEKFISCDVSVDTGVVREYQTHLLRKDLAPKHDLGVVRSHRLASNDHWPLTVNMGEKYMYIYIIRHQLKGVFSCTYM